ncbi:MAG: hypothetical protein ACOC5M_03010, partial [Chloroflexota bacterium]
REALRAWSGQQTLARLTWRWVGPVLASAPNDILASLGHDVGSWLKAVAKTLRGREDPFVDLCKRILAMEHQLVVDHGSPLIQAINHPVGQITEALLISWHRRGLYDDQQLPSDLRGIFTAISDTQNAAFRHGRVLLGVYAIALFRVDGDWFAERLLPLFDWTRSEGEARATWSGFLSSPRLYRPLIAQMKEHFLETARHFNAIDRTLAEQYVSLLTIAALEARDTFTRTELQSVIRVLPAEGLRRAAHTLASNLESVGEQRSEYWNNRVRPFLQSIWPQSREHVTPAVSETLARVCIAAGDDFPDAVDVLRNWLQPLEHPDSVVEPLYQADLCQRFPEPALEYLNRVVSSGIDWAPRHLKECLVSIKTQDPDLQTDGRFTRLVVVLRGTGREWP